MSAMRDYVDNYADTAEEQLLLADGFDTAIVGVMEGMGAPRPWCTTTRGAFRSSWSGTGWRRTKPRSSWTST